MRLFKKKKKDGRLTKEKAKAIFAAIEAGEVVPSIMKRVCDDDSSDWHRCSSVAYSIFLEKSIERRKLHESTPRVSTTSRLDMSEILRVNSILADFALSMPIISTIAELRVLQKLIKSMPQSEQQIIGVLGRTTMQPRFRVMQKKGRIEVLPHFKLFTKLIDAATISYYRTNFVSCYLTLLPVVEGIIIRWMGYSANSAKPDFEDIRKFFKSPHIRQPGPYNPEFHNIFSKACDKILNNHFYKPSKRGVSHANFNRHVASHILNDAQFATKENCIRIFLLIDMMTEIYLLEARTSDLRFALTNEEIGLEIEMYVSVLMSNINRTAEHVLLGTNSNDVLHS